MQAAPWPLAPVLGQVFKGFAYDGRTWRQTRGVEWSNVIRFPTSGRYVPSEDLIYVVVECIGPGGGGGWCTGDYDAVTMHPTAAGGGGSGGYSRKTLPAELVLQGADVAVPIGGIVSVGTVGGTVTAGDTSFGGLCVAHAGSNAQAYDGMGTVLGAHGIAGAGALPGVGDIALPGSAGTMWAGININLVAQHLVGVIPGIGGQLFGGAAWPPLGGGGSWIYTNTNGADGAANSGAGGGGAQVNTGSGTVTMFGGRGGAGLVIVTEICGTEDDGGGGGGGGGNGRPPGIPVNVNARVKFIDETCLPDQPYVDPRSSR